MEVPAAEAPAEEVPVLDVPVTAVPVADGPVTPVDVPEPLREVPAEHGASAETVMGLPDDDLEYTNAGTPGGPDSAGSDSAGSDSAGSDSAGSERAGSDNVPEPAPVNELTGSYDHLWDKTVVRRIEDAAVRDEPGDEPGSPSGEEPSGTEETDGGGDPHEAAPAELSQVPAQPEIPGPSEDSVPAVLAQPEAPAQPLIPAQQGGLIDSVPWNTGGGMPVRPSGPPSFVPGTSREAQPLAVPAPSTDAPDWQSPSAVPPAPEGDHDGETIMKSDLAGLGSAPSAPATSSPSEPSTGPMVLARVCPQGHANPPTHAQCAGCGLTLASDAVQVRRPRLGRVRVSTGELIDLDQSLVIGRQPSVSRVQGSGMPRLVQVASPSGDISRSHVEVRLEGWHVMLCDLKATNGTVLVREGQPPRRLAQNEMAILLDGDIAELGDDVSLRFEEIL